MKRSSKQKIKFFMTFGILFALSPIIIINHINMRVDSRESFGYINEENLKFKDLELSKISGKIHINDNWSAAKTAEICSGEGSYSEPYVIKDLVIDGKGSGSCILIENSNAFFRIENCNVYNSGSMGGDAGINLYNVKNSHLINNDCSSNRIGIKLAYSSNNTISRNNATKSLQSGIYLYFSNNCTITNNNCFWGQYGIYVLYCKNLTISKNKMNECGLGLNPDLSTDSIKVDATNSVNEKPVYYYNNKLRLSSDNFTNAGQIVLYNCHESSIDNLNISFGSIGISLYSCNGNNITRNIVSYNILNAIYLYNSDNNKITENTLNNNKYYGIELYYSNNNIISQNNASYNSVGVDLWDCNHNNITENMLNFNKWYGVVLHDSNNNYILGNTINYNSFSGIYMALSNYNIIGENYLLGNKKCIIEEGCEGNIFLNNKCVEVFPFEVIALIVSTIAVSGIAILLLIRMRKIR